ncbi:MAG: hypothetical protein MUO23_03745 [Anaerolineales bacterium]|nr:hypothetical protein [Anaerolineales bacterium]
MRDRLGFDGSSVGLKSVKAGDIVELPDLACAFRDPFWEMPTPSFICSAFEADSRQPFARDPRTNPRRAHDNLRETEVADESRWGPEHEFGVFDQVSL